MDDRGFKNESPRFAGPVMMQNDTDQLRRQVPFFGQQFAHQRVAVAQNFFLGCDHQNIPIFDQLIDFLKCLLQKDHFHYFADIVQQTGYKQLFNLVIPQVITDDLGSHGATQGMVPELFLPDQAGFFSILKQVKHRGG